MQCLTFHNGVITSGIKSLLSERGRRLVFLGSKGPGCLCKIVFFDKGKNNEPEIDDNGLVHLAYPVKRNYNHKDRKTGKVTLKERVELKKAYKSPTKILLRVNTSTTSTRKINGRWYDIGGWPTEWVNSHGYSSGQRWCDDLVVMDDADVITIILAGTGRDGRFVVRNDCGVISCLPEHEYNELVKAHERELETIKTQNESAADIVKAVEAGVDNDLEAKKIQNSNNPKDCEIDKETVMHIESGETIGE